MAEFWRPVRDHVLQVEETFFQLRKAKLGLWETIPFFMLFLEYPVTQSLKLRRSTIILIFVFGVLFTAIVTIISVVTVSYELVPMTSTSFNSTRTFWYDKLIPHRWRPPGQTCSAAIIKVGERKVDEDIADLRDCSPRTWSRI